MLTIERPTSETAGITIVSSIPGSVELYSGFSRESELSGTVSCGIDSAETDVS